MANLRAAATFPDQRATARPSFYRHEAVKLAWRYCRRKRIPRSARNDNWEGALPGLDPLVTALLPRLEIEWRVAQPRTPEYI